MKAETIQLIGITPEEFKDLIVGEVKEELRKLDSEKSQVPVYLTRKEVSKLLRVSLVTLHDWNKRGLLVACRVGRGVRYRRSDVISYVDGANEPNLDK